MSIIVKVIEWFRNKGYKLYEHVNDFSGGRVDIVKDALRHFGYVRASQAAASIAYYAFFSIFPLLFVLVAGLSYIVGEDQVQATIILYVSSILPGARGLVTDYVPRIVEQRSTYGILGLIALLWAGSNVFTSIAYNINLAWVRAKARNFIHKRLIGLILFGGFISLLVMLLFVTNLLNTFVRFAFPLLPDFEFLENIFWQAVSWLVPPIITFAIFYMVYRWIPNTVVGKGEALFAAIVVTILWQITSIFFDLYIRRGLVFYDAIYGSLATLSISMLWFYLNSLIILFGAHLSAAIAKHKHDTGEGSDSHFENEEPVHSGVRISK